MRNTLSLATTVLLALALGASAATRAANDAAAGRFAGPMLLASDVRAVANSRVERIVSLAVEQTPVSVAIVLDTSAGMTQVMSVAKEAVSHFIGQANVQDEFFLITAGNHDGDPLNLDTRVSAVVRQVRADGGAHGSPALLDSIYLAANTLKLARHERRAILVISDGEDHQSRYSRIEVLDQLREADLTLYALGLGVRHGDAAPQRDSGGELLNGMSLDTGGRYFEIDGAHELPVVMKQLDLRSQYVLGFWPSPLSLASHSHRIQLRLVGVTGTSKLRVYWRPGYFAPEGTVSAPALNIDRTQARATQAQNLLPAAPHKTIRF